MDELTVNWWPFVQCIRFDKIQIEAQATIFNRSWSLQLERKFSCCVIQSCLGGTIVSARAFNIQKLLYTWSKFELEFCDVTRCSRLHCVPGIIILLSGPPQIHTRKTWRHLESLGFHSIFVVSVIVLFSSCALSVFASKRLAPILSIILWSSSVVKNKRLL